MRCETCRCEVATGEEHTYAGYAFCAGCCRQSDAGWACDRPHPDGPGEWPKCEAFRTLPAARRLGVRDLGDCERHLTFCPWCRRWLEVMSPRRQPYDVVWKEWQNFLAWINKGRPEPLYQ